MGYYGAYYHAASNKIYGTLENCIVKCSPTTGKKESSARVCGPMLGPMRITGDATNLYVSGQLDFSLNRNSVLPYPTSNKQIWTVNPTTLAASNVLIVDDLVQARLAGSLDGSYPHWGPSDMKVLNGYMYFLYEAENGGWRLYRVSLTNPLGDNEVLDPGAGSPYGSYQHVEEFDMASILGTDYAWVSDPENHAIWFGHVDPLAPLGSVFVADGGTSTGANHATGCVYVASNNRVYFVCGNDILLRYDPVGLSFTSLDLATVITGGKPARIRLSPLDGKLYIPCQVEDTIIVWNPATETGIAKSGFDSPIDVVFTTAKAFAVQTGIVPLKEIT